MIPTPHIEVRDKDSFSKTMIISGDPLRAKFIAEYFMTDVNIINKVRNMNAYSGRYKGIKLTVMGHGIGIPSIGIYVYELFKFYGVEKIIRVGSCGSYSEKLNINDIVLVKNAYAESNSLHIMTGNKEQFVKPDMNLDTKIFETAKKLNIDLQETNTHSTDVFYRKKPEEYKKFLNHYDCKVVDMETAGLYSISNSLKKSSSCILTVSDSFTTGNKLSAHDRQFSFTNMITLALESALR